MHACKLQASHRLIPPLVARQASSGPVVANTGSLADGTAAAHVRVSPRDARDAAFASSGLARKLAGGVGQPGYQVGVLFSYCLDHV